MSSELQCYNRGCGQKFTNDNNTDDSCCHHPGEPFFHDAYKGWSCCNKKCTDFTEFLNIKGCTRSKHSNIKPPEPEKQAKPDVNIDEVIEVKPIVKTCKVRPPIDTPMKTMVPEISSTMKQQTIHEKITEVQPTDPNDVAIGTICKNGGCNASYDGPETNSTACVHHPGVPIFHEGLKFWSCCQKRTTDFNAFLSQVGCEQGKHVWIKNEDTKRVDCRWDYHQTGSHVVVTVYAKQYCPQTSIIRLNPIRLDIRLLFPQQSNASFELDMELKGIVDVENSQVSMYGSKVEIKLKKAEAGSWARVDVPRSVAIDQPKVSLQDVAALTPQVDAVDLDDL